MIGYGYPCMRPTTNDYQNPEGYAVALNQHGTNLEIIHRILNMDCLPGQWLWEGAAVLTCEIRAPYMLYCQRHDYENHGRQQIAPTGEVSVSQSIEFPYTWDQAIYFIPAIVLSQEREVELDSHRHGVTDIWHGQTVCFPKGAILAGGDVYEDMGRVVHLLEFHKGDEESDPGIVQQARSSADDDQWRFIVQLHPAKMAALQDNQYSDWRNALYVGCLAQMLVTIKQEFREQPPPHKALHVLADMIEEATNQSPPWKTEDDSSDWDDPLFIATKLHKLITPGQE